MSRRFSLSYPDSLRGRYLLAAFAIALLVVLAARVGQQQVEEASELGILNTQAREELKKDLRALSDDIWTADGSLQQFLLDPAPANHRSTLAHLDAMQQRLADIHTKDWVARTPRVTQLSESTTRLINELRVEIMRLHDIRTNSALLYPAMPLMVDVMLPLHTRFYDNATIAIEETDPATPEQFRIHNEFISARHTWTLLVGTFRNWAANHLGIFGERNASVRAMASNIHTYRDVLTEQLNRIAVLDRNGQLSFQQSESISRMREASSAWFAHYEKVRDIFAGERWRSDVPLLRETIHPLFTQIWDGIRRIEAELDAHSEQDLSGLARTADVLSRYLWWIALAGIALVVIGFQLFDRAVRKPIAQVARALKLEAAGSGNITLPDARLAETRDLVEAFRDMSRQVHSRQQRLETILDNAAEAILLFDDRGRIENFNKAAERLFGWSAGETVGISIEKLVRGATGTGNEALHRALLDYLPALIGRETELLGVRRDGTEFPISIKISRMTIDGKLLYAGLAADISERRALVDRLKNMAEHDALTGLYNRGYFQDELDRAVERVRRSGNADCALLYIDLDNFKYVNDTLGHAAGDLILIDAAEILRRRSRRGDLIARFGGDEFTVLLHDTDIGTATDVAESFRRKLASHHFLFEGRHLDIGCSIGVAALTPLTRTGSEALSHADLACHLAKRGGRNRIHVFNPQDAKNVTAMSLDMGWSRRIKEAIEKNHFLLVAQPIVDTRSRLAEWHEILIRMRDVDGQQLRPSSFLTTAERFGLSAEIDEWVIVNAIRLLAERRAADPRLRYSINLSATTLALPSLSDLIQYLLHETALDPSALMFEVTETVAIADMAAAANQLSRLQTLGCQTALDDFGSGMCSFAYLRELPVDCVKIDGRFVRGVADSTVDQAIVRAMNEISHSLGKRTIAEFVETEAAMAWLAESGVDYAQGFLFGEPLASPVNKSQARNIEPLLARRPGLNSHAG
jgi:diguanylate cyclase (GGDEF)-like protein/PAS domain S-box-containing protein